MPDSIPKVCQKIKHLKSRIFETSTETTGLLYEILDLLELGIDFCEFNLGAAKVGILYTLLTITKEKGRVLSQKLDEYSIELSNFK